MKRIRVSHAVAVVATAAVLAAAFLALFALRGDEAAQDRDDEPPVAAEPDRAPLTGLTVDDTASLDHPAVAIKVSDVRQAHPQAGVDRADIVFVEPVGERYTRLAAVFHSDVPDRVGPVRSVRPADAALLSPLVPVFGNTMGAGWVLEYTDGIADWDNLGSLRVSGSDAYVTDPDRERPNHVFADPRALLGISDRTAPPEPYFSYASAGGDSSAVLSGGPGDVVEVPYGAGWDVTWTYDDASGRYLREEPWGPQVTVDSTQVSAANVLVIQVESEVVKYVEGHGAPVPDLQLIDGSGTFTALSGGASVTGTWSKAGANDPFQLVTNDGDEFLLAPGNTWVELPAPSAAVTVR